MKPRRATLTLAQLKTFHATAKARSFTAAAEALDLSQPAVTHQIRALESALGIKLIDIVKQRAVLTDAGVFVQHRASEVLGSLAALERDIREFALAHTGRLQLGATLTIGSYSLPPILATFKRDHPALDIRVKVADTATMLTLVRNGEVNLALVEGPVSDPTFTIISYYDDRLVLVVPARGHRFSRRAAIDVAELVGEPFVIREEGRGTEHVAGHVLGALGIERNVVLELPTGGAVARAVAAGLGVAILSPLIIDPLVADKQLHPVAIRGLDLHRSFQIVQRRDHTLSPAAHAFIARLLPA